MSRVKVMEMEKVKNCAMWKEMWLHCIFLAGCLLKNETSHLTRQSIQKEKSGNRERESGLILIFY